MLLLRPAFDADMKQRAFVAAQRAQAQKAQEMDVRPGKRLRRRAEEGPAADPDLFATMTEGLDLAGPGSR